MDHCVVGSRDHVTRCGVLGPGAVDGVPGCSGTAVPGGGCRHPGGVGAGFPCRCSVGEAGRPGRAPRRCVEGGESGPKAEVCLAWSRLCSVVFSFIRSHCQLNQKVK